MTMESPGFSGPAGPLHGMFTVVPPSYDLVNRIVTLGLDRKWRRLAAEECLRDKPQRVLDLGCGTGDLTVGLARLAGRGVAVTGLDYSLPMLKLAREKAVRSGVASDVDFLQGNAVNLPFRDASFDAVGISFAFRNLTYKNPLGRPHLDEVRRVLRPGGRYVIVESSQPLNGIVRAFFHVYLRFFVGPVGVMISGNRGAYHYLAESTSRFYSPGEIREMLLAANFREVTYRPLFFGAVGIHVAVK
jgi:demethylmenaquinone methyltransferase/2-methoxy-6-polyprenyl-1,4-benzoquinol methylase